MIGKSCVGDGGWQNYLIFQPVFNNFTTAGGDTILAWGSKGLSRESIKPPATLGYSLAPKLT